jgi:hypothetical protein
LNIYKWLTWSYPYLNLLGFNGFVVLVGMGEKWIENQNDEIPPGGGQVLDDQTYRWWFGHIDLSTTLCG